MAKEFENLELFYRAELLDDVIPFWMNSDLIDYTYGGFNSSVDKKGKNYNSDKSVWFQGRCLWSFSKLCNTYGVKPEWKLAADNGAKFIKEHCIDKDGRMFFIVTEDGSPLRKRRYFFSESFLVVGFAEYYLVSKNKEDLELAETYFDLMYRLYRHPETDPFKITPKENSKVRQIHNNSNPMVLVSSAQTLRRISKNYEKYDPIIKSIIKDMIDLHYKEEYKCVLENVAPDGTILYKIGVGRQINPGHCIENSWFLMNYAHITNDKELLNKSLNILDWSLDLGWDKEYQGIKYFVDLLDRPREELEHDMKLWWVHNEALIATLVAYKLTGEEKYLMWHNKVKDYSFSHFSDKEDGEWYGYLHRDGSVSHTQKGSLWKGPYHLVRCLLLCEAISKSIKEGSELPELL